MMRPALSCVRALNALQNSMMLTPCWPSAGPTGGAGLAPPAGHCSFTIATTFFATFAPSPRPPSPACASLGPARPYALRARERRARPASRAHRGGHAAAARADATPLRLLELRVVELDRGRPAEDLHH